MNFLKIIFFVALFASNAYSAVAPQWAAHANIVQSSWQQHFLAQFRTMEGAHELPPPERRQVLEQFAAGHDNADAVIAGADPLEDYVTGDFVALLEAGKIPAGANNDYRDRRWTGGWLLNTMNIIRQQAPTNALFDGHGDLAHNDLSKIDGLSGTFWIRNGAVQHEAFSGMIQPGQAIAGTVDIISCFHGVWNKQLNELYFLPKGLPVAAENFYQVQAVQVSGEGHFRDQAQVDALSAEWNADNWGDLFQRMDHVTIRVNNHPVEGDQTLENHLHGAALIQADHAHHVINLAGAPGAADFHPTRIFAYGKPGAPFIQAALDAMYDDWDGFCLVSDLVGHDIVAGDLQANPLLVHPLRRNGHADYVPAAPNPLAHRLALPLPTSGGMSGGPIFQCEIAADRIRCRLLGVVHGSNLIQEADGHLYFKGLIAIPN